MTEHREGCECSDYRGGRWFRQGLQDASWQVAYMPPLVGARARSEYDIGYAMGLRGAPCD